MRRLDMPVSQLCSLAWLGDELVDWLGGWVIPLDGRRPERMNVGLTYRLDSAIGRAGEHVIYEARGTKGRLARRNAEQVVPGRVIPRAIDIVREIDRSYYHADAYDFPVCLFALPDGRSAIAHCPKSYNALQIELIDGTALTARDIEDDVDFFHSRLAASADGRWLLSNGWYWHPANHVHVFDVALALTDPGHLGSSGLELDFAADWREDVDAAAFVGPHLVVASAESGRLGVLEIESGRHVVTHTLAQAPGNLLEAWDDEHVLVFEGCPRLIHAVSGQDVHRWNDLPGASLPSQPGSRSDSAKPPFVACDAGKRRFALGWPDRVAVIEGN